MSAQALVERLKVPSHESGTELSTLENFPSIPTPRPTTPTPTPTPKAQSTNSEHAQHTPIQTSECFVFIRRKNGRYKIVKQYKLRNSLLAGVGFLELANAGDFAANVWNQIPVPRFAMALMALGGALALSISYFAFRDAQLSWRNLLLLREERRFIQTQRAYHSQDRQILHDMECRLEVNFRETGTEMVDRVGMDAFMGFGAVVVGIGTFMAIGGANPHVYRASNLLSGYIGNTPAALYGMVNTAWSIYVWRRAHRHSIAGSKALRADTVGEMLRRRTNTVKLHAVINGITGLTAGVASLITATRWWGYPILAPCIIAAVLCNYLWRKRIGYDRPTIRHIPIMDNVSLARELGFVASARVIIRQNQSAALRQLVPNSESLGSILEFIGKAGFFEDFCICILEDPQLSSALFGDSTKQVAIDTQTLLRADGPSSRRLLEIAQTCVNKEGSTSFRDRERFLLETLGCFLSTPDVTPTSTTKAVESSESVV